jgi:transcription elongation factor Elf1
LSVKIVKPTKKPTNMATCPNCKKTLSCGCQRRTASNGSTVCSSCLASYEKTLNPTAQSTATEKPVLNTWGKNRYKNLNKFIR